MISKEFLKRYVFIPAAIGAVTGLLAVLYTYGIKLTTLL